MTPRHMMLEKGDHSKLSKKSPRSVSCSGVRSADIRPRCTSATAIQRAVPALEQ